MSGFALDAPVFVPGKGLVRPASPAIGLGANGGSPAVDVTDNIPQEAITQLQAAWEGVTNGSTPEQATGVTTLVSLLKEHGPALLVRGNLVNDGSASLLVGLKYALEQDGPKSGLPKAKLGALAAVRGMCEGVGPWFEAYALGMLRRVLTCYKSAKVVIAAAEAAAKATIDTMSAHGVRPVLSVIFDAMQAYEWQVKEGAIALLAHATAIPRAKEEIAKLFPDVILRLIESLGDTRPAVRQAALRIFPQVCKVVDNPDVQKIIPTVIQAYAEPEKTGLALDALSACSFINIVDAPTLGLILPVLLRGMKERRALTKRKCAIIIYNMCKLVADPRDAVHFYPVLKPVLERAVDEVTNEDVRELCEKALAKLVEVKGSLKEEGEYGEEKARILPRLRHAVQKYGGFKGGSVTLFEELLDYVASLAACLVHLCILDPEEWSSVCVPYLSCLMPTQKAEDATTHFMNYCVSNIDNTASDAGTDEGEDVVNVEFSLGYGGKILLHLARLWLKKGHRYGIVGKNGCGKTTLMRNIANGSLDGLPEGLRTVYVESNPASHLATPVVDFVCEDASLPSGTARQAVIDMLTEVGFTPQLQAAPLCSLSGGWRMKLALAQAMLSKPDLLLLDEPTNHLDINAVKWLTDYVTGLKHVTVLVVSHSTSFLDDICSDILHYENQKLVNYPGNLSNFVRQRPEAKHYYELSTDNLVFNFPVPGRLDGVSSRTQAIIKMEDVTFTYPGAMKPQLRNVTLRLSRISRVAVVGANGAGKSTLIKLLVGETIPDLGTGEVWKHHNLRVAYVAQHSFHHLEEHCDKSPVEYIQWRFAKGVDKEILEKETMALTEDEKERLKSDRYGAVEEIRNRRTRHGILEYEVKFVGMHERENKYLTREDLEARGFGNLIKQADERVAAEAAGLDIRQLTTKEVQGHLNDFGLDQEFGTFGKIAGLSGGQKVKLVLAAAMWNCPHLLVLDEPTNFLDREALGAFATAIKEFQGGVIMISHDREFVGALCTETWLVEDGEVEVVEEEMVEGKLVIKRKAKKVEEETDEVKLVSAGGNVNKGKDTSKIETDWLGRPLSKAELRRRAKEAKEAARDAKAAAKK